MTELKLNFRLGWDSIEIKFKIIHEIKQYPELIGLNQCPGADMVKSNTSVQRIERKDQIVCSLIRCIMWHCIRIATLWPGLLTINPSVIICLENKDQIPKMRTNLLIFYLMTIA